MSLMRNSLTIGIVAFLAYCVYFDRKRRSDPQFKAKLKQKRLDAKRSKENNELDIPIFKDQAEMQEFFLKQIQISDELMMEGNFEEAAIHLAKATVVCSQKSHFLGIMQKSLPPPIFQMLYRYYLVANERYLKVINSGDLNQVKSSLALEKQFNDIEIE